MVKHLSPPPPGLDDIFHALSSPARRQMLDSLAAHECSVGELAAPLAMSLAAASKHVKVLERAGLISRSIEGRNHICRLNPKPLSDARAWFKKYERFWSGRLDALERALLEDDRRKGKP